LLLWDEIDRFAPIAELKNQVIDDLMCRNVERFRPKMQNAKVDYLPWRNQKRTEDTLFTIFAEWQRTRNLPGGEWIVKIL
jgi:hypothetical protein